MAEITDRESLEAWLEGKPRGVAVAIAARAALRSAPLLVGPLDTGAEEHRAIFVLATFRALAVASFAARWPEQAKVVYDGVAANAAAFAAAAAHDAAAAAVYASYAVATAAAEADVEADAWGAVSRDIDLMDAWLGEGGRPPADLSADLSSQPLWHDAVPGRVAGAWETLLAHLLAADEGWEVWTDWYERRLEGRFGPEALELAHVTIADEDWERGPAHVNAIIKRLIEEHTRPTIPTAETAVILPELPDTRPAPVMFEFREGALRKVPPPPAEVPGDRQRLAEQAWRALGALLSDLIAADPGRNSPKLARVLDACRSSLGASFAGTEVVALGVHAARLQGFAERADEFLMPEDAAELIALSAQIGLFLGQFPDWEAYANGISESFGTPEAETQAVVDGIAAINAVEAAAPGIVAPDAKKELADLADAATPEPSAESPGDVPPVARRSFLRSLRSGLLALCGEALSVVRSGVRKGAEKHFEAATVAALAGASAYLFALATGVPGEFGWLAGVVTYLTRMLGPSGKQGSDQDDDAAGA